MNFGAFLKIAREEQDLSFRQLEQKTDIDHAYIWRLEQGDNKNPSEEIVNKLGKELNLSKRKREIFSLLAHQEIPDPLYELMAEQSEISWDSFVSVATMSNRGKRPTNKEEWLRFVTMIDELG